MTLGEKVRNLRNVEGQLRGLGREMTQVELAQAIQRELKRKLSQGYISQIESGTRPHLSAKTREVLARFFRVHPGYLVDDPPGYQEELTARGLQQEQSLDAWLVQGSERFTGDPELQQILLKLAGQENSRDYLLLLGELMDSPGLLDRLREALRG